MAQVPAWFRGVVEANEGAISPPSSANRSVPACGEGNSAPLPPPHSHPEIAGKYTRCRLLRRNARDRTTMITKIAYTLAVLTLIFSGTAVAQKGGAEKPVEFRIYNHYFVKNNSGVSHSKNSYLVFTSQPPFDRIFGPAAVMGMGKHPFLTKGDFDSKLVVATIGPWEHFLREYKVAKVTASNGRLYVWYTFTDSGGSDEPGAAFYDSLLVLAVDRDNYSQVIFMEKGKKVASVSIPKS
jgi:hypothetical protein